MAPRVVFAGGVLATAMVVFVACSFPDVDFAPAGSSEGGGPTADASEDGASTDGGAKDARDELPPDVDPEGAKEDASTKGNVDTTVDGSDCTTCDCDHDGVLRLDAGCAGGPGAAFDCDDTDTYLPHQGFVTDYKWPSKVHAMPYDWNCDRKVDKQYRYDVKCGLLADCTARGFSTNPGCGFEADYIYCKDSLILGLACTEDVARREKRTQGCR